MTMVELERRLEWWCREGLISDDQARRILAKEREWEAAVAPVASPAATRATSSRVSAVVEGLGYIGGIFTLVGAVLLVASYWDEMSSWARLALGVGAAVVLLIGGLLVPESDPALRRLRWSLWTLSTAAAAVTMGVTLHDAVDDIRGAWVSLAVGGVIALENGALWARRQRPVQQALFLAAIPLVTGSIALLIAGDDPSIAPVGLVVAVTGGAILAVGVRGLTPYPPLTDGIGSVAIVIGVTFLIEPWQGAGYLTALVVSAALLVLVAATPVIARSDERIVIGVIAAVGLLQVTPPTIVHFANEAGLATGLVVAGIGVLVLEFGRRRVVAVPLLAMLVGGTALVGGVAVTAAQSVAFATLAGLVVAMASIVIGTRPGWAIMSVFGAAGLLVNVPWAISWFFPGEGRAPLLIAVAGVLIISVAVALGRQRGRLRRELGQTKSAGPTRSMSLPSA